MDTSNPFDTTTFGHVSVQGQIRDWYSALIVSYILDTVSDNEITPEKSGE